MAAPPISSLSPLVPGPTCFAMFCVAFVCLTDIQCYSILLQLSDDINFPLCCYVSTLRKKERKMMMKTSERRNHPRTTRTIEEKQTQQSYIGIGIFYRFH